MTSKNFGFLAGSFTFLLLCLTVIFQAIYYYPSLSTTVASHFDASGYPNGSMTKSGYFLMDFLLITLLFLCFWVLPAFVLKAPRNMINIPNKDFWLMPERFKETETYFRYMMIWLADAVLVLLLFVNQSVIRFNLSKADQIENGPLIVGIILFLAFFIGWLILHTIYFYKVPKK